MLDVNYFPAFTTRAHEFLAYSKCEEATKDRMVPVVTLTRYAHEETLAESLELLVNDLGGRSAIVDFDPNPRKITSAEEAAENRRRRQLLRIERGQKPVRDRSKKELENDEERRKKAIAFNTDLKLFAHPDDGPVEWVKRVSTFPNLIPILKHTSSSVLQSQLREIGLVGLRGALRLDPAEPYSTGAIRTCIGEIKNLASSLVLILDFKSIRGRVREAEEVASSYLRQVYSDLRGDGDRIHTVLLSNSFPSGSLKDLPRDLEMEELFLYEAISRQFKVKYGDYMSVPPRNAPSGGGNGFFPRVELVTTDRWHVALYENNSDQRKYVNAASDIVKGHHWRNRARCWGTSVIKQVSDQKTLHIDGKKFTTPGAWISVRANQHLTQMALNR